MKDVAVAQLPVCDLSDPPFEVHPFAEYNTPVRLPNGRTVWGNLCTACMAECGIETSVTEHLVLATRVGH